MLLPVQSVAAADSVPSGPSPDTFSWVGSSAFTYSASTNTAPEAGEYLQPIIAGFYPDPSLCRVGAEGKGDFISCFQGVTLGRFALPDSAETGALTAPAANP